MAIEDPIDAIKALDGSDKRQSSVPLWVESLRKIASALGPLGVALPLDVAATWIDRKSRNLGEFADVLADEIKRHETLIQKLIGQNEKQQKFVAEEMPDLITDAIRRAAECRAQDRVRRLAKILVHAEQVGAQDGADLVEEMMAIATGLSDLDVRVLDLLTKEFRRDKEEHAREALSTIATRSWEAVRARIQPAQSIEDMLSIAAKLASFGLAIRTEREAWKMPVYRPLERGGKFLEYIRGAE